MTYNVRKGGSWARLLSGGLVVVVATGCGWLLAGVANAAPLAGTLTFDAPPTATSTTLDVRPPDPSAVASITVETLKATVSPSVAGSVQFMDNNTNIAAAVPVSGGIASTKTTLPSGTHLLRAVFTPTDYLMFGSSTSKAVPYVVDAPIGEYATVTALTVFPTPARQGSPVVLLANIAPVGAVGTIQFMDGEYALNAPVPATDGFTLLITMLSKGKHSLTAVFTPTNQAVFVPSASPPMVLTVAPSF